MRGVCLKIPCILTTEFPLAMGRRSMSVSDPTHESVDRTGCAFGTAASTDKRDRIIRRHLGSCGSSSMTM